MGSLLSVYVPVVDVFPREDVLGYFASDTVMLFRRDMSDFVSDVSVSFDAGDDDVVMAAMSSTAFVGFTFTDGLGKFYDSSALSGEVYRVEVDGRFFFEVDFD